MAFFYTDKKEKYLIYLTAPYEKEIDRLQAKVQQKGLTLIPLRLYFNNRGPVKVKLALVWGKKTYDRRETIKKREAGREIDRAMKQSRS
jgi:SsrA-binding protein